ncbi:hypothetical protein NQ314_014377 [Rhamnusium bicolor]|uniref:Uncharacterized protein n=1 Tax=Rhamnusium bicolor TaxID=1586634 RepID=A0AAV8X2Y9_9CUCU|nr:hypothetical protein NQ314_014377 [Rhamnusium bicolor]
MGNMLKNLQPQCETSSSKFKMKGEFTPVYQFKFLEPFDEDSTNGLCLNNVYLPEEIIENILSYVPPTNLLGLTLVCKRWCNIIKSENFWMSIYNRRHPDKAKKLPWYVFYSYFTTDNFHNILRNGNGQEQYKYWTIVKNYGDEFKIENPPIGSEPLPPDVPDFNGRTSCFATSYQDCSKIQEISLRNKRLLRYILNKFMPHIYVSEWVAGRFDCGCMYKLGIRGYSEEYSEDMSLDSIADSPEGSSLMPLFYMTKKIVIEQWEGKNGKSLVLRVV